MLAGTSGGVAGSAGRAVGARVDQPRFGREGRRRFLRHGHTVSPNVTVHIVNILVRYRPRGRTAKEISASVEAGIRAGQLAPGDQLPPVRELAGQLGVSPATVAAAYGDLRRRGLTAGAGRAGTRVRGAPPVSSRVYLSAPAGTRDLITGGPDPDLLPLLPAWPARRPARMYAEAPVSPRLRRLAAEQLAADGIDTDQPDRHRRGAGRHRAGPGHLAHPGGPGHRRGSRPRGHLRPGRGHGLHRGAGPGGRPGPPARRAGGRAGPRRGRGDHDPPGPGRHRGGLGRRPGRRDRRGAARATRRPGSSRTITPGRWPACPPSPPARAPRGTRRAG